MSIFIPQWKLNKDLIFQKWKFLCVLAEGCCTFCHYIFHCQLFSTGYTNLNSHFVITILVDTKAYKSNRQMPAVQSDSNERNVLFFFELWIHVFVFFKEISVLQGAVLLAWFLLSLYTSHNDLCWDFSSPAGWPVAFVCCFVPLC